MIVEMIEVNTGEIIFLVPCLVPAKWSGERYSVVIDKATIAVVRALAMEPNITPQHAAAIFSSYYAETWRVKAVTYEKLV